MTARYDFTLPIPAHTRIHHHLQTHSEHVLAVRIYDRYENVGQCQTV